IGTDSTGARALPNAGGIRFRIASGRIGGTTDQARNIISGNSGDGILVFQAAGLMVQGNFIGTDVSGKSALGNSGHGVSVNLNSRIVIGGDKTQARNIISGNLKNGVDLSRSGGIIQNNFIGVDSTGASKLPNDGGVNGFDTISSSSIEIYGNV